MPQFSPHTHTHAHERTHACTHARTHIHNNSPLLLLPSNVPLLLHHEKVFDAMLSPFKANQVVSCGVNHVKFWSLAGNTMATRTGTFDGARENVETQLCLAFEPAESETARMFSASITGAITIWNTVDATPINAVQCHQVCAFLPPPPPPPPPPGLGGTCAQMASNVMQGINSSLRVVLVVIALAHCFSPVRLALFLSNTHAH